MKQIRKFVVLSLVTVLAIATLEIGAPLDVSGFVSKAEARVGRPLTPVSVAGAGRRTVRRCAAGVYNC